MSCMYGWLGTTAGNKNSVGKGKCCKGVDLQGVAHLPHMLLRHDAHVCAAYCTANFSAG